MTPPLIVSAASGHAAAIRAIDALLDALKLQHVFVGTVARCAWLGGRVESDSVDVLALLSPERMRQVPMMASNRGFVVDRGEVERAEELDLVPLRFGGVRIHVLMATNALYGRMFNDAVSAQLEDTEIRVVSAEDLALLLLVADDEKTLDRLLMSRPDLDLETLNQKLIAIGLSQRTISR